MQQKGIALLALLIFLQMMTLYLMYAMENSFVEMRISQEAWEEYQLLAAAEYLLQTSEKNGLTSAGNYKNFQFNYQKAFLKKDSCAEVSGKINTVNYFKITLVVFSKKAQKKLQSEVAQLDNEKQASCVGKPHEVTLGRQSWAEL